MIAILLAVIAMVGWGSGDVFATALTRRTNAYVASAYAYAVIVLGFLVTLPFAHGGIDGQGILVCIGLGTLLMICYTTFCEALRIGNPSVVGTISGAFVALVVIFSVIFLGEKLTGPQIFFIGLIVPGILLASFNPADVRAQGFKWDKSIVLSFLVMIGWGVYFTAIKIPIDHYGWYWPTIVTEATGAILALALAGKYLVKMANRKNFALAAANGLLGGGGTFAFNGALALGASAVVAPIAGAYPVLFVVLSMVFFKEKMHRLQIIGMTASLVGIVGLAFVSG
jgi:drug/metabolite transporter (DMT)-like permease